VNDSHSKAHSIVLTFETKQPLETAEMALLSQAEASPLKYSNELLRCEIVYPPCTAPFRSLK